MDTLDLSQLPDITPRYVEIDYTNHRGERALRRVLPLDIWFGPTEWHPQPGWLLRAVDLDKDEQRDFAMKDVHAWRSAEPESKDVYSDEHPPSMQRCPTHHRFGCWHPTDTRAREEAVKAKLPFNLTVCDYALDDKLYATCPRDVERQTGERCPGCPVRIGEGRPIPTTHGVKARPSSTFLQVDGDEVVITVRGILCDLRIPRDTLLQAVQASGSS